MQKRVLLQMDLSLNTSPFHDQSVKLSHRTHAIHPARGAIGIHNKS